MDILHLSDLHFRPGDDPEEHYGLLADDLRIDLKLAALDAIVVSGDVANFATPPEYELASQFLTLVMKAFSVPREAVILTPGNHDADWSVTKANFKKMERKGIRFPADSEFVRDTGKGRYIEVCDPDSLSSEIPKLRCFPRGCHRRRVQPRLRSPIHAQGL